MQVIKKISLGLHIKDKIFLENCFNFVSNSKHLPTFFELQEGIKKSETTIRRRLKKIISFKEEEIKEVFNLSEKPKVRYFLNCLYEYEHECEK